MHQYRHTVFTAVFPYAGIRIASLHVLLIQCMVVVVSLSLNYIWAFTAYTIHQQREMQLRLSDPW